MAWDERISPTRVELVTFEQIKGAECIVRPDQLPNVVGLGGGGWIRVAGV